MAGGPTNGNPGVVLDRPKPVPGVGDVYTAFFDPLATEDQRDQARAEIAVNIIFAMAGGPEEEVAKEAVLATRAAETIETSSVRFTQSSVKQTLSTGENINDVIAALKGPGGDALARDFKPIGIFERNGSLFTLDNRRLLIFSQAERQVPFEWATAAEVDAQTYKFTATAGQAGGWFIRVK